MSQRKLAKVKSGRSRFKLQKTYVAHVKFFEELYILRDIKGEVIFTGTEAMAKKILKLLRQQQAPQGKRRK